MAEQIIFLPGASGNRQYWEPASQRIASPSNHILFGWPGFSGLPRDPSITRLSDLTELVLPRIDRPTDLVAQSMGGVVAMQTALKRPELISHLILTVTSGGIDMRRFNQEDWWPQYLIDLPDAPRWFVDDRTDLTSQLHAIETPTLLIWSDSDPVSPLAAGEFLAERLPNAELVVIKGAGSSGPHHQDSGEAKIRESTAGVSRKPSSDCKACGCSSKHLCGLTAWNT